MASTENPGQSRVSPSPNCDDRPEGERVSLVVIHNISLPPGEFGGPFIEDLFLNRLDPDGHPFFREIEGLKVSAHYLVRRDGEVVEFVDPGRRAWHAGVSTYKGRERCNDFSVGIEMEGADDVPFAEPQYDALNALVQSLRNRFGPLDLAGHSDIAPGRKTDPGPWFDWSRLNRGQTT